MDERSEAEPEGRPRWHALLLAAGLLVQLAPLLLFPLVLSQDGPAHLDGAWVLLHHGDDGAVGAALRSNYALDLSLVPNMLTTLLMAGLLTVLGPDAAEKVVVAGFVVLLVAGLRYALRGVDRRAGWLAVAALPLAGGQLVAYGFYNFCWGVALALVVLGVVLRRGAGWRPAQTLVAAVLFTLVWSAHLLPWAMAVLVAGGLSAGRWIVAVRAGTRPWRAATTHLLQPLLAVLPGLLLSLDYVVRGGGDHGAVSDFGAAGRLWWVLTLYRPLVVGSWWELVPAVAVALVLGTLAVAAVRGRDGSTRAAATDDLAAATARADRVVLGVATVLATAAMVLTPGQVGPEYGFMADRLAWFPPLLLVLFCATRAPRRAALRRVAAGVLVLAATAAVLIRLPTAVADQRKAAEVLSVADSLPPGATFAVLRFAGAQAVLAPLAREPDPLRHLSSRLAVEAGAIDVGHYEAVYPYFQVRFRPGSVHEAIDPGREGLETVPPRVDLSAAGSRLQYVVVEGLDQASAAVRSAPATEAVLAQLRAGYVEVSRSSPTGLVTVWRLRGPTAG